MPPLIFPATFWPAVAASGPTPPISANLARWYSANYGITSSGGVVSQMNDLSGNGQHATQATGTKQPALTANARKTNSMISFDGTDDALTFNGITLTGDFTIYWVGSIDENPSNTSAYFTQNDPNSGVVNGLNNNGAGTYWYNGGDILQGNDGRVYQTSIDIVCVQRTGSTITCEINDLDASTCPANSNPTIGAIGPAYIGYSQMKFGEMLVYTSYHNATDKATVKNALKSTWKYPTLPVSGASLWLDGSRWDTLFTTDTGSTNVTTNAGAIGRWEDLSGNARHATQATSGSRPTWSSPNNGRIGLGAVAFNGSSQNFTIASNAAFNFGTGDFTVEGWVNPSSLSADWFIASSSASGGMFVGYSKSVSPYGWGVGRNAVAWDYITGSTASINTWYHVAVCRSGTSLRIFINGTQVGTTNTNSQSYDLSSTSLTVGSQGANYYLNGKLQNLLIYKGQALYTANFTPFMS